MQPYQQNKSAIFWLAWMIALLAASYAGIGLFSQGGAGPFQFTTLHGQTVEIYGWGVYRYDSAFKAAILRGTDAVTLFVAVPALILANFFSWRGSQRGRLLLAGLLVYFLYNALSLAFGAVYNELLLLYIGAISASFFALLITLRSFDLKDLAERIATQMPYRGIAIFIFIAGLSPLIWLADILTALMQGTVPPHLGPYTTEPTYILDLALIMPAAFYTSVLCWRRQPQGVLLAAILLTFLVSVGLVVIGQSVLQALEGIAVSAAEIAAYVAPFVLLSLVALGLLARLLRRISDR